LSFKWLFIADGTTCIFAGLFFYFYFRNVQGRKISNEESDVAVPSVMSAFRDRKFIAFTILTACFAILFFQLFFTLPLYYRDIYHLSEGKIGGLLALNGLIVFGVEMILVYVLGKSIRLHKLIFTGLVLVGVGFAVLVPFDGAWVLVLGVFILSIAEILAMPFMVTFVVERSIVKNRGSYMGLYSFAFSVGHVFSPILGAYIIERYGFNMLWSLSGLASVLVGAGFWLTTKR